MSVSNELLKKRAQIFTVDGGYTPSKTSIYLRMSLFDNCSYFSLSDEPVIEAINFSNIVSDTVSEVYAEDTFAGFTGKSYLKSDANADSDYPIIYYPIKAGISGTFDVWIRRRNPSGTFDAQIYIDDVLEDTISVATSSPWVWSSATITISDTDTHTLGIKLNSDALYMDEILIQPTGDPSPSGSVALTDSPYNTIHAQLYTVSAGLPSVPLVIDGYKTTIEEISQDGWYNFDLNFITTAGVTAFSDETYALVIYAAGAREKNFVSWELVDSNEYLVLPVAAEE